MNRIGSNRIECWQVRDVASRFKMIRTLFCVFFSLFSLSCSILTWFCVRTRSQSGPRSALGASLLRPAARLGRHWVRLPGRLNGQRLGVQPTKVLSSARRTTAFVGSSRICMPLWLRLLLFSGEDGGGYLARGEAGPDNVSFGGGGLAPVNSACGEARPALKDSPAAPFSDPITKRWITSTRLFWVLFGFQVFSLRPQCNH